MQEEHSQPSLAAQIGQRIRKIRQMRGFTQKVLAGRLVGRVDYSYIGKIERGEQLPSLKVLERLADALTVPVGYFFSDEAWTDLLPEEIRRMRWDDPRMFLLRETIQLHPEDIPLVREILRILIRHRHQVRARAGTSVQPAEERDRGQQPLLKAAEGRPAYLRTRRQPVPDVALQAIGRAIRSLSEGEEVGEVRRRLRGILRELRSQGLGKGKERGRGDG